MNIEKLSKRLETVAKYIPNDSIFADIGSDHAYLPCYAVRSGIAKKAIAGEVSDGPFKSAQSQVIEAELLNFIDVRKGDGLDVVGQDEVNCITIAGMGGTLISSILERGKEKLEGVRRLILQPNIGAINVRTWLMENGWELIAEEILEEDTKIYEILVAEKGDPLKYYNENKYAKLLMGPFLLKEKNSVFIKKWVMEKEHWERILKQIDHAEKNKSLNEKKKELELNIQSVEEALQDEKG